MALLCCVPWRALVWAPVRSWGICPFLSPRCVSVQTPPSLEPVSSLLSVPPAMPLTPQVWVENPKERPSLDRALKLEPSPATPSLEEGLARRWPWCEPPAPALTRCFLSSSKTLALGAAAAVGNASSWRPRCPRRRQGARPSPPTCSAPPTLLASPPARWCRTPAFLR